MFQLFLLCNPSHRIVMRIESVSMIVMRIESVVVKWTGEV